jgi:cation diffusion facilitator CzcD-associated flavoprotein CzcO
VKNQDLFAPPSVAIAYREMISFLKGLRARKKEQDAKHPTSLTFTLADHAIDHPRPMKVVVVGAGFSGLVAGIRLSQRVKNLDLIIYEAQAGIGGVWYANKYPGVACDIPSHCYQLSFEPNRNWSAFYAPGAEIQEYLHGVAEKYNLLPYIKLEHRLVHAQFCEETGKWNLRIQRPIQATSSVVQGDESNEAAAPVEIIEDTADVLLTAFGALSQWKWPDIEGLRDFKGKLIHSARWDEEPALGTNGSDKSWKDQKVAVIGVGSSALQIVPSLQPKVGTLYNYVRGKTWIGVPFVANKLAEFSKSAPERNCESFFPLHSSFESALIILPVCR